MHDLICESTNSEDVLLRTLPSMRGNWDLNNPIEFSIGNKEVKDSFITHIKIPLYGIAHQV